MESLLILGLLLVIALPASVVYLLVSNAKLKTRVSALEARLPSDKKSVSAATDPRTESTAPSPWPRATPEPPDTKTPEETPTDAELQPHKTVVLNMGNLQRLIGWITQNWFYAVSAVSLALAGIFLVLYGVEQGLLPPSVRVMGALVFGIALVAAGEYIRRTYGDSENSSTAYLPSTFSGAGIVTLFGAVAAARLLYGFIGSKIALAGLAVVGALAMILGWFYGPLLAAVGVIGAMAAPFIIDGASDDPSWLLIYFAIVTMVGLAIDTLRRWAWVSVISLAMGYGAGQLLTLGAGWRTEPFFVLYCALLVIVAIAIPARRLLPDHAGTPLSRGLFVPDKEQPWPEFPTRLVGGAVLAASGLILLTVFGTARADLFWTAIVVLTALAVALLTWARNATALTELAVLPAVSVIALVAGAHRIWAVQERAATQPGANMTLMPSTLVAFGLVLSIVAAWHSLRGGSVKLLVAAAAALFAPAMAIAIEAFWSPVETLGPYPWALHAMAIAGVMVVMAERFARADGPDDKRRVSFAVLAALACVAFGVTILLTSAALTTAFAVTIVAAAWLDRQFNLPLMGLYILAGIATVGYRLVVDPGLIWAIEAPLPAMLLSHGGAALSFALSWFMARAANRPRSAILLESAAFSAVGLLISLFLHRAILQWSSAPDTLSHWSLGIGATIWIILGMAQVHRMQIGGPLSVLRLILSVTFLSFGAVQLALAVSLFNPLVEVFGTPVLGSVVFNTLIPAYLLPALLLALGALRLRNLARSIRIGFAVVSGALASLWLGLTIRHFWRGTERMHLPEIGQAELYSYTVALLLIGAGIFYQSLARPNAALRKAGLIVIGLAVAKVFMLDIGGLGGLIRVFSLLFLGLALAGLAWLNRWAAGRDDAEQGQGD